MRKIVILSATRQQDDSKNDDIPVVPFRLSPETRDAPSKFVITFIASSDQYPQGVRYQYGFLATTRRIHEEWLFAYPNGRPQHWFSRAWSPEEEKYEWHFPHKGLRKDKNLWKRTREDSLFLSVAANWNSEELLPVFNWFKKKLKLAGVGAWSPSYSASLCLGDEKSNVIDFLDKADIHVEDILVDRKPFDPDDLPVSTYEKIKPNIEHFRDEDDFDIRTVRKGNDEKPELFDFKKESHGTQKIFSFAGPWINSLEEGNVIFIDELHNSLHPKLVQLLVEYFHDNEENPNNAQLVFTTHETSILNQKIFRRDQIWFCEKDKQQATELFPLSEFSPRKGRENLEGSYLSGRYGAIPFIAQK